MSKKRDIREEIMKAKIIITQQCYAKPPRFYPVWFDFTSKEFRDFTAETILMPVLMIPGDGKKAKQLKSEITHVKNGGELGKELMKAQDYLEKGGLTGLFETMEKALERDSEEDS